MMEMISSARSRSPMKFNVPKNVIRILIAKVLLLGMERTMTDAICMDQATKVPDQTVKAVLEVVGQKTN